jgi:hypothetical protein
MLFLEWFLIMVTAPFWVPLLLMFVGFFILLIGVLLLSILFISLCLILWSLKTLYNVHVGLVDARQTIIKEIENGINSNMSWWRTGRLVFIRYMKHRKEIKEMRRQYMQEEKEKEKEKEIVDE